MVFGTIKPLQFECGGNCLTATLQSFIFHCGDKPNGFNDGKFPGNILNLNRKGVQPTPIF